MSSSVEYESRTLLLRHVHTMCRLIETFVCVHRCFGEVHVYTQLNVCTRVIKKHVQ